MSFNAKGLFAKERGWKDNLTVLAIGSSMTLNNLNSETIVREFGKSYFNISSWGLKMEEDFKIIKICDSFYKPKIVLISSNLIDFQLSSKSIDYNNFKKYVFKGNTHISLYNNLKQFFEDSKKYHNYRANDKTYRYLSFDSYGGINYSPKNFKILKERWNGENFRYLKADENQYRYLDSIARFCSTRDIKFIFAQSPYRKGWTSNLSDAESDILESHILRIKKIIEENKGSFINSQLRKWDDSLFVDYSHLNKVGSKIYTSYIIESLKDNF